MVIQISKVAWIEVCLVVSQTTHVLYGLKYISIHEYLDEYFYN